MIGVLTHHWAKDDRIQEARDLLDPVILGPMGQDKHGKHPYRRRGICEINAGDGPEDVPSLVGLFGLVLHYFLPRMPGFKCAGAPQYIG